MRLTGLLIAVAAVAAQPVLANEKPILAHVPDWVVPVAVPQPAADRESAPVQFLLMSGQVKFDGKSSHTYVETAVRIQHPQALQLGNITLPWQPERADLLVHKVQIIRAGKVIDVLGTGQAFTVVRRERQLETATLDGVLTAVLQPEGLAVGDTLVIGFSLKQKAGVVGPIGEDMSILPSEVTIGRVYYRQV